MGSENAMSEVKADRLLTIRDVATRLSVGRSTLYLWISKKEFPPGVRVGRRCARWSERKVEQWIAERPERSLKAV